jgi:hypothetical protein
VDLPIADRNNRASRERACNPLIYGALNAAIVAVQVFSKVSNATIVMFATVAESVENRRLARPIFLSPLQQSGLSVVNYRTAEGCC